MLVIGDMYTLREEPLMIWRGGSGKSRGKKINGYWPWKKTQLNNPEEKKLNLKITHQPVGQEKKTHQPVGQEKKLNTNSLPKAPLPDH